MEQEVVVGRIQAGSGRVLPAERRAQVLQVLDTVLGSDGRHHVGTAHLQQPARCAEIPAGDGTPGLAGVNLGE
jgi:hypothetical protein